MDDDVMDQQKFASAAMVLAKAMVDLENKWSTDIIPSKGISCPKSPYTRQERS